MKGPNRRLLGLGLIVGIIVVIVLGVTSPNPFSSTTRYWAVFNTAHGLGAIDRDVRISGVKVGKIGEVQRIGDDVRAEILLDEDPGLHMDARADMRPHTLFEGSNFVDLSPGSPSAPILEPGGEIPLEQTTNYVTLDEALRILRPEIRENLRSLAGTGANTFKGAAIEGIQRTLKGAPDLVRDLAPAARAAQGPERRELAGTIRGLSRTVDAVATREAELAALPDRLNRTSAAIAVDGGAPLGQTLSVLPGALRQLQTSSPALTAVIDRLDRFSGEITPGLPDLRSALAKGTPVLRRATPVLKDAEPLIRDAHTIAGRLGDAGEGGLTRMLELLQKPLPKLTETLEVFNEDTKFGIPGYRQLVAGSFSGADALFSSYRTAAQGNPGHVWRAGMYLTPTALLPLNQLLGGSTPATSSRRWGGVPRAGKGPVMAGLPDCDLVEAVSKGAAADLQKAEACE
jgi:virulence factor Mce-like protein